MGSCQYKTVRNCQIEFGETVDLFLERNEKKILTNILFILIFVYA